RRPAAAIIFCCSCRQNFHLKELAPPESAPKPARRSKIVSAALPPHNAERLCLSDQPKILIRGYASIEEAQPLLFVFCRRDKAEPYRKVLRRSRELMRIIFMGTPESA